MIEVSPEELKEKIQNKETMMVDFYATWCIPCGRLIEELNDIDTEVPVYKINVEDDVEFSKSLGIRSVPTVKIFKEGQPISTMVGFKPKSEIKNILSESLS
jgi:thioredoxin 1